MSILNKLFRNSCIIKPMIGTRYVPTASAVKKLREMTGSPIGEC